MSRALSVSVTIAAAAVAAVLAPSAAYADVAAGNCTTTYAAALESDVLVNGPVHDSGGTITGGNFTPSTFESGATAPTSAYLTCMV
jgi:phage baseplate assembly protein gpV